MAQLHVQARAAQADVGCPAADIRPRPVAMGGGSGFLLVDANSSVRGVVQPEVANGRVVEINIVLNPAKLTRATT